MPRVDALDAIEQEHRQIEPAAEIESLRRRVAELEAGEARREAAEEAIRILAATTGDAFLRALAPALSKLLGARYVAVSELLPGGRMRTLAWYGAGRFLDDVTVKLAGTPCQMVVETRGAQSLTTSPAEVTVRAPSAPSLRGPESGARRPENVGDALRDHAMAGPHNE